MICESAFTTVFDGTKEMTMKTEMRRPAQYLSRTSELLWKHAQEGSRGETALKLPETVCLAAATQFDCAVDEWQFSDAVRSLPEHERYEHLNRHMPLAIALRETLEA